MRWEVTYAKFIKTKYEETNDVESMANSSSEDTDEVKIQMQDMKHMHVKSDL